MNSSSDELLWQRNLSLIGEKSYNLRLFELVPNGNIFPFEENDIARIALESTISESILNDEGS